MKLTLFRICHCTCSHRTIWTDAILVLAFFLLGCMKEESKDIDISGPIDTVLITVNDTIDVTVRSAPQSGVTGETTFEYRINEQKGDTRSDVSGNTAVITLVCSEQCEAVAGNVDLVVPEGVDLSVSAENGDVIISDFTGDVDIWGADGNVFVNGVTGDVDIMTANGDIRVQNGVGRSHASTIGGKVHLNRLAIGTLADVAACRPDQPAAFLNTNSITEPNQNPGRHLAQSDSGAITATCVAGDLWLKTYQGKINIGNVMGAITATCETGSITARNTVGDVDISITGEGNILTQNVRCEQCDARTPQGAVTVQ